MWSILGGLVLLSILKNFGYLICLYFSMVYFLGLFMIDYSFLKVFKSNFMLEEMNMWFIFLSLMIFYLLSFNDSSKKKYMKTVLMSLFLFLIFSFFVSSIFFFFIFFELSLLPTSFLIMMWGVQPERLEAVSYFLVYALFGSFPLLSKMVNLVVNLKDYKFSLKYKFNTEYFLMFKSKKMLMFFWVLSFLMKLPMYSLHLWLPKAHVEAPVVGSMVLAAMLLKLGGYGLIRLSKFYLMTKNYVLWWSLISVSLVSLITLRSKDVKALMAYSSVAHMALTLYLFLLKKNMKVLGALMILMGHGFMSSVMFFNFKIFYESSQSRKIFLKSGKKKNFMIFFFFFILCLKSSLPLNLTFFSELIISNSVFYLTSGWMIVFFMIGVLFVGLYKMKVFLKFFHGSVSISTKKYNNIKKKNVKLLMIFVHMVMAFFLVFFMKKMI